ncbi:tubulointerstitial nephritis antigen-like [Chrysoperla carnea]|uniref:tubulointerstitial nephritis antigen-like n=1 Tax=Chrysoperla carnea TaxID=189513 RepID=UPI001D063E4D|nr:tubulointerstitial nephritis antigen-like [Chrysoperla carnea]
MLHQSHQQKRNPYNIQFVLLITTVIAIILPTLVNCVQFDPDLPPGPYCATRQGQCCPSRNDDCSYPILGTRCYCDDFCNRTIHDDCCPDYWSHCRGIEPPPATFRQCTDENGKYYIQGQQRKKNCNTCTCSNVGERAEFLCEDNECLVDTDLINDVNNNRLEWSATNYSKFWGHTLKEGLKLRLGTFAPSYYIQKNMNPLMLVYEPKTLPRQFDAADKWRSAISPIRDQGWCGSSWAISTTSVASDRLGIMSVNLENVDYSPQHLISCNIKGQQGCNGGHVDRAWTYLTLNGVVNEECFPYEGVDKRCPFKKGYNLVKAGCRPKVLSRKNYYVASPWYSLGNETDIMEEIRRSGPVQAIMTVYPDLFVYQRGIYSHLPEASRKPTGYHSVRIVGWGEERGVKYWKVANSWGKDWGEDGYFRIVRGKNECNIERYVFGTWVQPENFILTTNP